MTDESCSAKEDSKVYSGERLIVDFHRLQGWSTLSSRQVRIWVGVAQTLTINDFSQLSECDTAQWWLALCAQEGGRACAKSHIERLAASQLRFRDWSPARERTLLDRDMTASNRWGRALGVLTDGGVQYAQYRIRGVAGCRPRRRLHPGGLHRRRTALRRNPR